MKKKITIDGTNYTIDINRAKELGVLDEAKAHRIGGRYKNGSGIYMLSAVSLNSVALIDVECGNRWKDAVRAVWTVEKCNLMITDEDFNRVAGGEKFTKVS